MSDMSMPCTRPANVSKRQGFLDTKDSWTRCTHRTAATARRWWDISSRSW